MRLSLWCICAAILLALPGCDDYSHIGNVLEIKRVQGTGFNNDHLCLAPDRAGAELAFRVNATTQKVLITIVKDVKDDGKWGIKDKFLDNCSVVDHLNWKCSETERLPDGHNFFGR